MERTRRSAALPVGELMLTLAAVLAWGCGDEDPSGTQDSLPPEVEIVHPADGSTVVAADGRPAFEIHTSDRGTGVFASSIQAMLSGRDVSDAFRNGFVEATGEVRLKSPDALVDGGNTLVFTVSDRAGNETTARSTFGLSRVPIGPPPPPD